MGFQVTAPKVNTIQRGGSRLYVHPDTGAKVPGVTSILNMLPKGFLKFWAAKMVAEAAIEMLPELVGLAVKGQEQAAIDMLKRSPDRNTKKAADAGTDVHELYERLARGEKAGRLHPDLEPYAKHFDSFVKEFDPEFLYIEETVWSETHGYAGSFDWIAKLRKRDNEIVVGDNKTTRSGVHEEVALQMAAYSFADYIVGPTGEKIPMPEITSGAVLHVRPDAAQLVPTRVDRDLFEGWFLPLLRVFDWERNVKSSVLGRSIPLGEAA